MSALLCLLLAASVDGEAALRHASALAALGPHPLGSARNQAAAAYVAAALREAGLDTVELQAFEHDGLAGTNVVGTLPAPSDEFVVIGAHHDTAPEAAGAYDDGGGVGILVELARVLARDERRARALVFVSFDGEEAGAAGKGATTPGSRAFVERLGPRARSLVAAFLIEMSGWKQGTPALHPIAYADLRRPGRTVVAPAWLVRAALDGSREAGAPLRLGDPFLSWLYQPAVRAFRVRLYGDDLSFLQAGHPALFASDSSFSAFYPDYHAASDTADKLDAASLERMGRGVVGIVRALDRVPRGPAEEPNWFAALGLVVGWTGLAGVGLVSVLPGLVRASWISGLALGLRFVQALLAAVVFWRHPVPALFVLLVPLLLLPWFRGSLARALAAAPAFGLVALGAAAWWRGAVNGVWLAPWEIVFVFLAFALSFLGLDKPRSPGRTTTRRKRRSTR